MRIISLSIVHYGAAYLPYALRSVHDAVDAQYVLYTPQGSHGHRTSVSCPDTREMLIEAAIEGAGDKLRWHEGVYANESEHRAKIHELEPDAECIVVVDADEIYSERLISTVVANVEHPKIENPHISVRRLRLPMWHYFRSFKRGFMHDPALPERVIFPKYPDGVEAWNDNAGVIHHFGYAIRSELMAYKWQIHGHKAELRHDVDRFNDVFMANRQYDCHPVGSDAWNCEDMDASQLPSVLDNHPFKDMDVIP